MALHHFMDFPPDGREEQIEKRKEKVMTVWQVILAIIFPPLAVINRGCGSFLITLLLTAAGWVPGVIAALVILNKNEK